LGLNQNFDCKIRKIHLVGNKPLIFPSILLGFLARGGFRLIKKQLKPEENLAALNKF